MNKQLENYIEGKQLTHEEKIDGVGTVNVYGSLDLEKLIQRLLQSKHITA
ncbi:hypothetical protein [Bacillus nitratireducens]|nr:hypothetical protein [Bacillus nitratireducens]QUG82745.1 hypothetical protein GSN03_04505 [Bacillus nitratireducens]